MGVWGLGRGDGGQGWSVRAVGEGIVIVESNHF